MLPEVRVDLAHRPGFGRVCEEVVFEAAGDQGSLDLQAACVRQAEAWPGLRVLPAPTPGGLVLNLALDVEEVVRGENQRGGRACARTVVRLGAVVQPSGPFAPASRCLWASRARELRAAGQTFFHPSPADLRDEALEDLGLQIIRLLQPWTEPRNLVFFPDPNPEAFARLEAGDVEGALRISLEALRWGTSPEVLAAATYNAGLCLLLRGDSAAALPLLASALDLEPRSAVFREAWEACRRELALERAGTGR